MTASRCAAARSTRASHSEALHSSRLMRETWNCMLNLLTKVVHRRLLRSFDHEGVLLSHALVNKLGEKGRVDHELSPLCVVSRRRFSRHRLFQRSACF